MSIPLSEVNPDLKDFLFKNLEDKIKRVRFDLTNMKARKKRKGEIQLWVCDVETWITDCNDKEYLFDVQKDKEWGGCGTFSVHTDIPFKVITFS